MSLALRTADWFLRADPPDRHTKTSWCFIGPALRLKPPGKNTRHRDSAPTPHIAKRWQQYWENLQLVHI